LITLMSLFALAGGLLQFTIGTTRYTLKNISSAASSASATLKAEETQAAAANKLTAAANLPVTIAVALAALTQAGIVSLTTVVAIVLRGLGAATTGAGRAAGTVAFYTWYLAKKPEEQAEIRKQGAAVASATGEAATSAINTLKTTITGGIEAASAVVSSSPVATTTTIDTTPITEKEKGEAAILLTGAAIKASETVEAAKPVAETILDSISSTVPEATEPSTEPGKPEIPGVTGVKKKVVESLKIGVGRSTRSSVATKGGKKKTKKRSPKRRITRRKPRITFAY
jgi:hypothetical protein